MGWKREGILDGVYDALRAEGHNDARDELARRTGIPGPNLSGINRGNRDMTAGYARRIVAAVDGVTPLDLGADEDVTQPAHRYTTAELGELMEQAREAQERMWSELERLADAVEGNQESLRVLLATRSSSPQRRRSNG